VRLVVVDDSSEAFPREFFITIGGARCRHSSARMDALLAAYDSNDDDDDDERNGGRGGDGGDEEEAPRGSPARPATAKRAREDGPDDVDAGATDGSGRVRAFPHVDGNFATHVYVPLALSRSAQWSRARAELGNVLARIAARVPGLRPIGDYGKIGDAATAVSSFVIPDGDLHVSLSHTFPIRAARRDGLFAALRRALSASLTRAWVARVGPNLDVLVNANRTTTFLAMRVADAELSPGTGAGDGDVGGSFAGAYSAVDAVLTRGGYPRFHDDPKPHASVAFAPGDVEAELVEAIKELCFDGAKEENAWNAAVSGITTRCSRVVCKVSGAPGVTVWGRAEGELPPPDI
jgi:hypothetical protein